MPFRRLPRRFLASEHGNFAMITALVAVPLVIMVGFAVDYNRGSNQRAAMQDSLDAASFAAIGLPPAATEAERNDALKKSYASNGGKGSAEITSVDNVDDVMTITAAAQDDMPTTFMRIAARDEISIGVESVVTRRQALLEATFKAKEVTGWWDKRITLWGREEGVSQFTALMEINYVYNGLGDVGLGTTSVRKLEGLAMIDVFRRECPTVDERDCLDNALFGDGTATVDVSKLKDAYLQMDISASTPGAISMLEKDNPPRHIRTDDPKLSSRVFINGKRQKAGSPIDILRAVQCGVWGEQAWEDGGTAESAISLENTDFKYDVMGKCGWRTGTAGARLAK